MNLQSSIIFFSRLSLAQADTLFYFSLHVNANRIITFTNWTILKEDAPFIRVWILGGLPKPMDVLK
jgi:hypothetical protein